METFVCESSVKFHAIRMDRGEDLLECFNNFLKKGNINDGVVVSGIGTLDQCCMHFVTTINDASKMEFKKWKDVPLEIVSVEGIVANGSPHLHMVISNTDRAWAGHVEKGCRTLYLCEIMFMEIPGFGLDRKPKTSDESHTDHYIKNLVKKSG
jgi:predicted DNA-binding protein with PD1-like motif